MYIVFEKLDLFQKKGKKKKIIGEILFFSELRFASLTYLFEHMIHLRVRMGLNRRYVSSILYCFLVFLSFLTFCLRERSNFVAWIDGGKIKLYEYLGSHILTHLDQLEALGFTIVF